jgi:hypothetical protein
VLEAVGRFSAHLQVGEGEFVQRLIAKLPSVPAIGKPVDRQKRALAEVVTDLRPVHRDPELNFSHHWDNAPGWRDEPPTPVHLDDEGEPVEPGYIFSNMLLDEGGFRPFRTRSVEPRVAVPIRGGILVYDLGGKDTMKGTGLLGYLAHRFYDSRGYPPNFHDIEVATRVLTGRALDTGLPPERVVDPHLRVAPLPNDRYGCRLDLGDSTGRFVVVDRAGWQFETSATPVFARKIHMRALPEPVRVGYEAVARLWKFAPTVQDRCERLLIVAKEVERLLPMAPKPVSIHYGDPGSMKSSSGKHLVNVTDPSTTAGLSIPTARDELQHHARTFASPLYDNVSEIDDEISDQICALVTGASINERLYYTNDGESIAAPNPLPAFYLNGVAVPHAKPDLLDRAIFIHHEKPELLDPPGVYLGEERVEEEWTIDHPFILGGLLDLASRTFAELATGAFPSLPFRMEMFVRTGIAMCRVLCVPDAVFIGAYERNAQQKAAEVATDEWFGLFTRFARSRLDPVTYDTVGSGNATLDSVDFHAAEFAGFIESVDSDFRRRHQIRDFPKSAGRRITLLSSALGGVGLTLKYRLDPHANATVYTVTRAAASPAAISREAEVQANMLESGSLRISILELPQDRPTSGN